MVDEVGEMAWFLRILFQWLLIAAIIVGALVTANIYVVALAGIVVFGLIAYGFANPAFMVRRAIVWAATTIIAAFLIPEIPVEPIISQLAPSLPDWAVGLIRLALQLLNGGASPWALVPLCLLVTLEIASSFSGEKPATDSGTYIMPGRPFGLIVRSGQNPQNVVLDHTIVVTNSSPDTIFVSQASLKLSRFGAQVYAELYEAGKPDQISASNPMKVPPDTTVVLDFMCRSPGPVATRIVHFVAFCRLWWFVDFQATVQLFGNLEASRSRLELKYRITRRQPRR